MKSVKSEQKEVCSSGVDFIGNKGGVIASTVEVCDDRFKELSESLKRARKLSDVKNEAVRRLNLYEVNEVDEVARDLFASEEIMENQMGIIDSDDLGGSVKVVGNLKKHLHYWINTGCSDFVKSVISEGYKSVLSGVPVKYREKNNASFGNHKEFAQEAIAKLLR